MTQNVRDPFSRLELVHGSTQVAGSFYSLGHDPRNKVSRSLTLGHDRDPVIKN